MGAVTKTYTYPATNNKLSSITGGGSWTYVHDANGAITSDGVNTFTYDTRGRLTGATTALGAVSYQLNSLGQRYQKSLQGTTTVYLYDRSGKLIAETADQGQTYTQYVWLADTPVALIKPGSPNPSVYFIHSDHLDTPRLMTDPNQQKRWRWDNDDPFGGNVANENPSGLGTFTFNLRFPGQYFDKETGNHYNYYRDYSPEIGRYIESDPIGLQGGINTYAYVGSSPLLYVDVRGLAKNPPICFNPRECVDPPIDPPTPANPSKPLGYDCVDVSPSPGACLVCCGSRGPAQYLRRQGSTCQEQCLKAWGITQAPLVNICAVGQR